MENLFRKCYEISRAEYQMENYKTAKNAGKITESLVPLSCFTLNPFVAISRLNFFKICMCLLLDTILPDLTHLLTQNHK